MARSIFLLFLVAAAVPARAGESYFADAWIARAVDGDTLDIAGTRIRLRGVDAPELSEGEAGRRVQRIVTAVLAGENRLECHPVDNGGGSPLDRYGRTVAVCTIGRLGDLGAFLVKNGLAAVVERYDDRGYALLELRARIDRAGFWTCTAAPPRAFRRRWAEVCPDGILERH